MDPEIAILKRQFKELYTQIKWEYKFINRALTEIKDAYKKLSL